MRGKNKSCVLILVSVSGTWPKNAALGHELSVSDGYMSALDFNNLIQIAYVCDSDYHLCNDHKDQLPCVCM